MKYFFTIGITLALLSGNSAFAAMHFQPEAKQRQGMTQQAPKAHSPKEKPKKHSGMQRKKPGILLMEGTGASVTLIRPDGVILPLEPNEGKFAIPKTGLDNYHALVAEKTTGNVIESAIRYVSLRGKPSGHSPSELTAQQKASFEIVPAPLPREHWHYTSGKNAVFTLRLLNEPIAGAMVFLTTANGTTVDTITDSNGKFAFQLPEDFEKIIPGRRKNAPVEFRIEAEVEKDGKQYFSSLSDKYYVNPNHWQSFQGGLLVMALGMGVGLFFTFKNHKTASRKGKKS